MQRRLRWFGHAARRPEGELIKALLLPTPPRTRRRRAEDMGYHDQGRPGTDLRTASLRPRTMEKGLGESLYTVHFLGTFRFVGLYKKVLYTTV